MNKQEFITLLEKRLFELPQVEKEHLLNYYNETIEDRIEDGMSEAEAVASLDSVEDIVKQIYSERAVSFKEEEKPAHSRQRWRIVLIELLSPFLATLLCVFAMIYLLLWTLIALLFCSMLAFACFIVGGIWNLIPIWKANAAPGLVLLGTLFLCIGLLPLCWRLLRVSIIWLKQKTVIWIGMIKHTFAKAVK